MIKLDEPVGDAQWGPTIYRLAIGSYFMLAGLMKLDRMDVFLRHVVEFGVLPKQVAILYGTFLPYAEVTVGFLLLIGFWTTLASLAASVLLVSFIVALGVFPNSNRLFNKDIILLGGTVALMFSGGGRYSLDRFRRG
jgi:uncharacterized membrane protein YphA (DoxX/SURF4 family)